MLFSGIGTEFIPIPKCPEVSIPIDFAARMKLGYFVIAVLVFGSVAAQFNYENIEKIVSKLWKDESMEFLGHRCEYYRSPSFNRWKLYHKATVMCPGWTTIIGQAKKKSRIGSLIHAKKDFVEKALRAGIGTEFIPIPKCPEVSIPIDFATRMKLGYFVIAVLVFGSVAAQDSYQYFVEKIASQLWKDESMEFLGHRCEYSRAPSLYKWKLYHKTSVMCPGWTTIIGQAKTKSRMGSLIHAKKDFVEKALRAG
ncbi:unnamed protein product [Darwinula stevensoni]|uniref:Uncharacterized protein n=1 Tax=Darwinula stevensoni TaxID=69355 RepID=A0A7R8XAT3_9CRUS|nr:unnamed protein product [Darwinula stevensoni]CAG0885790.1 unnamed protein product [Darwinula stevensoni]